MGQGISLKSERKKKYELNHDLTFYCIHNQF
jgi:hypothetical protein